MKEMNEQKKLLIIGIIAVIIILAIPITYLYIYIKSKNVLEDAYEYIAEDKLNLVYIGRDDCYYCNMFNPDIKLVKDELGLEYLYINTNDLMKKHLNELLAKLDIAQEDFGTPHLVVTKNSSKVAEEPGYVSEDVLVDFLKEAQILPKDAKLPLNYVNFTEYSSLIASKSKQLIVIGQSGCSGCNMAKPDLFKIAKDYNVTINYLNVSLIEEENQEAFQSSLDYFTENGISTPLMLVVSDGKVLASETGSIGYDAYVTFLKEQGFIKE